MAAKRLKRTLAILSILWVPILALIVVMGFKTGFNVGFFAMALLILLLLSLLSLFFGFILSDTAREMYLERKKQLRKSPFSGKSRLLMLSPYLVILIGAFLTRMYGNVFLFFPVTIVAAMAVTVLNSYYLWVRYRETFEGQGIAEIGILLATLIIPFSLSYFMFLFFVCRADFERMKSLFAG